VRAAARGYTTRRRGSPPRVKSADGATDLRAARGAEEFDVSKCRRSILNGECNITRDAGQIANENSTLINFMRSCCTCEEQGGLGHGAKGIMAGARQRCTTQSRIQSSDKGHRRRWARFYRLVRENERGSEKGAAGDMHEHDRSFRLEPTQTTFCFGIKHGGRSIFFSLLLHILGVPGPGWTDSGRRRN
jgi:hypothetical protein